MVNGVLLIVAAVLFAVVGLSEGMNVIWLGIAGLYLLSGILNLGIYWFANNRKQKKTQQALKKAEEKAAQATTEKQLQEAQEKPAEKVPAEGG